jgi:hypothetical protein
MDLGFLNSGNMEKYPEQTSLESLQNNEETQEGGAVEAEFEVESILKKKKHNNILYFLVKWKNFPLENCTWEPRENLENAQDELARFESSKVKNRSKPQDTMTESTKKGGKAKSKEKSKNLQTTSQDQNLTTAPENRFGHQPARNTLSFSSDSFQQEKKNNKNFEIERGVNHNGLLNNLLKNHNKPHIDHQSPFQVKVENATEGSKQSQSQGLFSEASSESNDNVSEYVDELHIYGSLDYGDIPLKVVGVRPVEDENDLEVMMSWQVRPDGVKPEDSRVMRFDLIKKGFVMPLIEFYETKMKLERVPTFKSPLLSKQTT